MIKLNSSRIRTEINTVKSDPEFHMKLINVELFPVITKLRFLLLPIRPT